MKMLECRMAMSSKGVMQQLEMSVDRQLLARMVVSKSSKNRRNVKVLWSPFFGGGEKRPDFSTAYCLRDLPSTV